VRPTRRPDLSQSFITALRDKYTGEVGPASAQIQFSGKVAEEVGFEKIRRKQANLAELKYAVLDGNRVASPYAAAAAAAGEGEEEPRIAATCPRIVELELSRNLFTKLGPVVDICAELPALRGLRLK
jgi:tubulin-specific chaperone E